MTNYRLQICEYHDLPQFEYCFDCGSPLMIKYFDGEKVLTCSKNWVHVKIFLTEHIGDKDKDDCEGLKFL